MWKTIPGFDEHYLVNEDGEVYSLYRNRLLSVSYNATDGYGRVGLNCGVYLIHRLVAMAFLGIEQDKYVNHKDGNKQNNCLANLEWVTPRENALHSSYKLHKTAKTENIPDRSVVIELHNNGYTSSEIARRLNTTKQTIGLIVNNTRIEKEFATTDFELCEGEHVKQIPEYPLYYASNFGRIFSSKTGKCLKLQNNGSGYLKINLYKDGIKKGLFVHRLVMSAFCGQSDLVVNHIDGNKQNNRLDNLEYATQSDNIRKRAKRKLNDADYREIIRLKSLGYKREAIAEMYHVRKEHISRIVRENKNRLE